MASAEHEGIIKISPQTSTAYLQISCTNEYIALPATENEVGLWRHGKLDKRPLHLRSHSSTITALCFGHKNNPCYLCSASKDAIIVWKAEQAFVDYVTGTPSVGVKIAKDLGHCCHLCFSPDDFFVAACIEKEVWIINIENCKLVATLEGHTGQVTASIFCPHDISKFVTISEDRTFKIWDIKKAALIYQSSIISSSPFWSVAMHPEHMHFSVGSADGKVRVYDMVSHRCLHEVDIMNALAKRNSERRDSSASSDSDTTISTEVICPDDYVKEISDPTLEYNETVREVLKDPPYLIAGCTSVIAMFDANTMDVVFSMDLMESMICTTKLDPVEYCVSSAGCFAFSTSTDTLNIHCLAGSMFENNVHALTIQPDRTQKVDSGSSESEASDAWSESQDSYVETKNPVPAELTVLSTAPLVNGSPLQAMLESKQSTKKSQKGSKTPRGSSQMDQPLTFNSKVKSSGYSATSRSAMFTPKTNASSKKNGSAVRKVSDAEKAKGGVLSGLLSDCYPMKSDPPVQLVHKSKLPPKPTSIVSLAFSDDGKQMSSALGDKHAFMFKIPYTGKVSSYTGHDNVVNTSQISHDNSFLLTSSDDKTAKLWSKSHSNALLTFSNVKHNFQSEKINAGSEQSNPSFPKEITKASFYYVDKFVLLSCLNSLYMYKYHIGEEKNDIKRYHTQNRYKLVRDFKIKGVQNINIVLAACSDKSIAVFDMNIGKVARTMKDAHTRVVHTICQNQGSPYVSHPSEAYDLFLTSAPTDGIKLWDLRADRCVRKFDGHVNRSQKVGLAYSPCSRYIATGSEDRCAYVFDIRNSAYLHRLAGQSGVVSCVDFHPQKPMLATGSLDGEIRFYSDVVS
eukprot:gene20041-22008_t